METLEHCKDGIVAHHLKILRIQLVGTGENDGARELEVAAVT